jgi:ribose transport system permease protein
VKRSPVLRAFLALLLVVAIGCAFHAEGAFFKWSVQRDMLRQVSVHGILACGLTVVILSAGIDLSVGSVLALAAVSFAKLTLHLEWPAAAAVSTVLALGLALGAFSGGLVARFRIQPFVVTLAGMVFARGAAKLLSGGQKVTNFVPDASGESRLVLHPPIYDFLDGKVLGGNVAVVTLVFLGCSLATWTILERMRLGRHVYAVGGNEEAARLAGVPVGRTLVAAYALCGLFSAVAGVCQAAQETHGDPETGLGYELDAIAMVVLGGTSLAGGRGSVVLTGIGVLTIGTLRKILSLNAVPEAYRLMLTAAIIVAAVLFQKGRP